MELNLATIAKELYGPNGPSLVEQIKSAQDIPILTWCRVHNTLNEAIHPTRRLIRLEEHPPDGRYDLTRINEVISLAHVRIAAAPTSTTDVIEAFSRSSGWNNRTSMILVARANLVLDKNFDGWMTVCTELSSYENNGNRMVWQHAIALVIELAQTAAQFKAIDAIVPANSRHFQRFMERLLDYAASLEPATPVVT